MWVEEEADECRAFLGPRMNSKQKPGPPDM